ncbi:hypothetical protein AKJ57_01765 [candidate division MSBL1 archaeon SCGC-AAA259A05]|uniref:ISXO2-like transposase domain-containing protein n=1 Tax=candidate division MSBL1 archaeon SCGC-AAA259A05 TaxID=1698259 RepID=A0A133UAR5_9EURY|nr:hypothetical protein AKJ57_01765 [candidate division MSBL1 archaeon SCGC-AAA259A05]
MPSEEKCFEVLRELRWEDGIRCPRCGSGNVREHGEARKPCCRRYWCRDCERTFNDLTGTIFADTNIDLGEWVYAMDKLSGNMSMNEISEKLGRDYNTVMRIRDLMASALAKELFEELEDKVEIDETYVPVGRKGSKTEDRPPRERGLKLRGRGTYEKDEPPIVGSVQRGGKVVLREARKLGNKFVRTLLGDHTEKGSKVYHDDFSIYNYLPGYDDVTLNHSEGEYVDGEAHTNTIEGVFSLLKSWLRNFRGVRKDNLWKYLKIFEFDFNLREYNPFQKLTCLFTSMIL